MVVDSTILIRIQGGWSGQQIIIPQGVNWGMALTDDPGGEPGDKALTLTYADYGTTTPAIA